MKGKDLFQNLALISQVGVMMIVPIFAGIFIGNYIGNKFDHALVGLVIGLVLGVGASFRNLYMLSMQKSSEYQNKETPEQYVKRFEKQSKKK